MTFDRPEARNAITWAMYDQLVEACEQLDGDETIRVLILRGAGGSSLWLGPTSVSFRISRPKKMHWNIRQKLPSGYRLEAVTKPTIATITGPAAGAGAVIR